MVQFHRILWVQTFKLHCWENAEAVPCLSNKKTTLDLQVQVQAFPYQALHCLLGQEQTYNGLSQERTAGDGDPVIV